MASRILSPQSVMRTLCASLALLTLCSSISYADDDNQPNVHAKTRTPIKHLVVFFQENETFDHYFGTYPKAANIPGETSWIGVPASQFHARPGTPAVNAIPPTLLSNNPNTSLTGSQANPQRLRPMDADTCDMNHGYTAEQLAVDGGLMDHFVQRTASTGEGCQLDGSTVMNYYDGNTVTALWNYAQNYAMSDSSFDTNYGPTFPGHLNLISGNTHGAVLHNGTSGAVYTNPADGSLTVVSNIPEVHPISTGQFGIAR